MCSTCRAWKNAASEAANVATTVMAQTSSTMSSTRPGVVPGFGICELTVGSCAETQNSAPPKSSKPEPRLAAQHHPHLGRHVPVPSGGGSRITGIARTVSPMRGM
jgi:hypothetical protein